MNRNRYAPKWLLALSTTAVIALPSACETPTKDQLGFKTQTTGSAFSPKGSPWTILCMEIRGPSHQEAIRRVAETLKRTAGIRPDDVVVIDDPSGISSLYYGTYFRKTSESSGKRGIPRKLKSDIRLIKELVIPDGRRPFMLARTVRIPGPDVGNPEWRLDRVNAEYSLQVAVFEPTDEFWDFKKAAAEYCEAMRGRGYEAYYHHGEGASMVTVGQFGSGALINQPKGLPLLSPEITALQEDEWLKYNRLNGRIYTAMSDDPDNPRPVRVPSRLVKIPKPKESTPW